MSAPQSRDGSGRFPKGASGNPAAGRRARQGNPRARRRGRDGIGRVLVVDLEGAMYLVAPRGHTRWVRNLRVAGEGQLMLGRRRERFVASEIADADKEPILRSYLRRWTWEVGIFFGGVDASSASDELRRIAPDHPVFRVELV